MATVRQSLIDIIELVSIGKSGSIDAQFETIVDRLEALIEPAVTEEKDTVRYLISLMNLFLEIRRGILAPAVFEAFFANIAVSLDRPPLRTNSLFQGGEAQAESFPEAGVGCTIMRWNDFKRFYAPRYGAARSTSDLEKLWSRILTGGLRVPREDLHLSSSSGVVWMTDAESLGAQCGSPGPHEIDGTEAYDALGLDWPTGWSYTSPIPEVRAIVLSAPISHRRRADGGLRVPTSIDAWGGFGFVPKQSTTPRTWPSNAGVTVDPTRGSEQLPEAVHAPMSVPSGADCPILPCSPVRKAAPDRIDECGRIVCMRAIVALRAS